MGNTPSTPDGRDPRRDAKLKLKSSTPQFDQGWISPTSPFHSPYGSPPESSGQFYHQQPLAQLLRQRLESTSQISLSEGAWRSVPDIVGHLPSESRDTLSALLTPRGSTTRLVGASQTSLAVDPKAIDLKSAVAILEELRKTASPEDLVALREYDMNM
jgi:hypothetical protein